MEIVDLAVLMLPATPVQYLTRWRMRNRVFGDDAELHGLTEDGHRIVISQADLSGDQPEWPEIEAFLSRFRLRRIESPILIGGYDSRSFFGGRLGVFDVRPVNFVRTAGRQIAPIDLIPQYFGSRDATVLRKYIVPDQQQLSA